MTENEMILLHDRLYEYLKGLHHANPSFMFTLHQEIEAESWKQGYWFVESGTQSQNNNKKTHRMFELTVGRALETILWTNSSIYTLHF